MNERYKITLLFNANKVYDRQIIEGIGEYLQASRCEWNIFLEEDFVTHLDKLKMLDVDGIIADFDDPDIQQRLKNASVPVIGVGSSYSNPEDYPQVPYVATDNGKIIELAFKHLKEKGIENFAFYGLSDNNHKKWSQEREKAFRNLVDAEKYKSHIYCGNEITHNTWQYDMNRLSDWIQRLPMPIGIIAATDSRARLILQACEKLNIMVPDKVSVIGIDDDEVARSLTRVSLSSVAQGSKEMGYCAARMLHKAIKFRSANVKESVMHYPRVLVEPLKVISRQSSDFHALKDQYVIQAMHFIRNNACKGIKVEQVLDFVGISRSNLELRFKEERGHSIHQEIHDMKIDRACTLLATTSLPIVEIADMSGYPSLQYMYNVFKKNLSITPKDYRDSKI